MSSNKLITLDKKRNNLSLLFEICEKIFDNNLLKYKYIFIINIKKLKICFCLVFICYC